MMLSFHQRRKFRPARKMCEGRKTKCVFPLSKNFYRLLSFWRAEVAGGDSGLVREGGPRPPPRSGKGSTLSLRERCLLGLSAKFLAVGTLSIHILMQVGASTLQNFSITLDASTLAEQCPLRDAERALLLSTKKTTLCAPVR